MESATMERLALVHVRAYERRRLGQREHVREHWRSWPQLRFAFMDEAR